MYDVTGSLCENNDKFAVNRVLPRVDIGDWLVIHDSGMKGRRREGRRGEEENGRRGGEGGGGGGRRGDREREREREREGEGLSTTSSLSIESYHVWRLGIIWSYTIRV